MAGDKGLAAIVIGLAASFFLFGYALVYWRNADMDFMVVYNALLLNDGKPQQFVDHPAYITILSVQLWFKTARMGSGCSMPGRCPAMPAASNVGAFDAAMTSAVRAGRLLAWLTATGCVLIFAGLMRLVVRDRRVALIATFAFAFSGGVAIHARILRSELLAAFPVLQALLILIVIGQRAGAARPLAMALAALLCVLGMENKVQAILLIAALPLVRLAVRRCRQRQRRVLAQSGIGLARRGHRQLRHRPDCVAGIAADRCRVRWRFARRGAIPSPVSGKIRRVSGRAPDADRRLHDCLRRDLAGGPRPKPSRRCLPWRRAR